MLVNIAEIFELLFDKNNNVAYKALQELQRKCEETDIFAHGGLHYLLIMQNGIKSIKLMKSLMNI